MGGARAAWTDQNGAMWIRFTQEARLAYVKGFLSAASSSEAHCRVNILMKQAKEKLSQEQITPLYSICKTPTQAGSSDEKTVERVTEFYGNPLNVPIVIPHVLELIAMRSEGETAERLAFLTKMYRTTDTAGSH
jgi:hypothetical protein